MEPQGIRNYLSQPWKRPIGRLQRVGSSTDDLPVMLDGVVTLTEFRAMLESLDERTAHYKGGLIAIGVALFQTCLLTVLILGFVLSRFNVMQKQSFFNPITVGVLGTLEFGILSQSARFFQQEERNLCKELLELFRPWRAEYSIIAKMRRVRGKIAHGKGTSTYYCLVLEKITDQDDTDTMSVSTYMESVPECDTDSRV